MIGVKFTEVNPDKGTETYKNTALKKVDALMFTEVNPDKGTETASELKMSSILLSVYRS